MKKKTALFICMTVAALSSVMPCSVFADDVSVYLNESKISFTNTPPSIVDGRTLVPLRGVFDAMGYEVEWDGEEKAAYLSKGDTFIETSEVEMILTAPSGSKKIECDVLPRIIDGSFMIPLRAVSEATGAEVEWDAETRSVYITSSDEEINEDKYEATENFEGTMSVDEKEYIETLKEATDYIFDFATDNDDKVLKALLFEYEYSIDGTVTASKEYYSGIQEKIDELKILEPPAAMNKVHDCVFSYLDVLQRAINNIAAGTYTSSDIEADRQTLKENAQTFGVYLYDYFIENGVNFEALYGAQVLDALKRN